MPRQHPELQQGLNQLNQYVNPEILAQQQNWHNHGGVPNIPEQAGLEPRRRENREFTPDLWNEVQTLILELSDLKKKLIEKGVI